MKEGQQLIIGDPNSLCTSELIPYNRILQQLILRNFPSCSSLNSDEFSSSTDHMDSNLVSHLSRNKARDSMDYFTTCLAENTLDKKAMSQVIT